MIGSAFEFVRSFGVGLFGRGAPTVGRVCEAFLAFKAARLDLDELSPRTFEGYQSACAHLIRAVGADRPAPTLAPEDFARLRSELAGHYGPRGLGSHTRMIRGVFRWALKAELIAAPLRFGHQFDPPPRSAVRRAVTRTGMFEREDLRRLVDATETSGGASGGGMRAFILLGINCGFGQKDIADAPAVVVQEAIRTGWLRFARQKTGAPREARLWPQTRDAMARCCRSEGRAFLTRRGNPWVRSTIHRDAGGVVSKITNVDSVGLEFRKLARRAGVTPARFYCLRRTFATVADSAGDPHAVARCMGHLIPGMAGVYVQRISPERLASVSDHVRRWLFGL